jgi:hypothetical protein
VPAHGVAKTFPCCIFPAVRFLCVLGALFSWTSALEAQILPFASALPSDSFQRTVQHAGLIFDGTVIAIQCEFGKGKVPLSYRISFQVKQGVRGARSGSTYTIREWAGLWAPRQPPRYRVGERSLLFFYPPGPSGLTSTVGGRSGKLVVVADAPLGTQVSLPLDWLASMGQPPPVASLNRVRSSAPAKPSPTHPTRVPVAWLIQRILQAPAPSGGD